MRFALRRPNSLQETPGGLLCPDPVAHCRRRRSRRAHVHGGPPVLVHVRAKRGSSHRRVRRRGRLPLAVGRLRRAVAPPDERFRDWSGAGRVVRFLALLLRDGSLGRSPAVADLGGSLPTRLLDALAKRYRDVRPSPAAAAPPPPPPPPVEGVVGETATCSIGEIASIGPSSNAPAVAAAASSGSSSGRRGGVRRVGGARARRQTIDIVRDIDGDSPLRGELVLQRPPPPRLLRLFLLLAPRHPRRGVRPERHQVESTAVGARATRGGAGRGREVGRNPRSVSRTSSPAITPRARARRAPCRTAAASRRARFARCSRA